MVPIRIASAFINPEGSNAYYRMIGPLRELARRGHTVLWPGEHRAETGDYDVLYLQQFLTPEDLALVQRLRRRRVAVVWETDDDISAIPKSSPAYANHGGRRGIGGRRGLLRTYERTIAIAQAASLMTTPSAHLAQNYRDAGVEHVQTIGNRLPAAAARHRPARRRGLVLGCVLAAEHAPDLAAIPVARALQRVLDSYEDVRVIAIGLDLGLRGPRYAHRARVEFDQLLGALRELDVGLAPLADTPFSRARSDVKAREYAAAGAMWLASPVGPYVGLGEEQGGRLVHADGWHAALDEVVRDHELRTRLRANARRWAARETVERSGAVWETAFRAAVQRSRAAEDIDRRAGRR